MPFSLSLFLSLPLGVAYYIIMPRASSVPQVLVLNDCGIDQAGEPEDLKKKCYTVKELDLAQNKLENWNEVWKEFLFVCQVTMTQFSSRVFTLVCDTLTG